MIYILKFFILLWNGFVSIIDSIIRAVNLNTIKRNNQINSCVVNEKPVPSDTVFCDGCLQNAIISGSEQFVRNLLLINALQTASNRNRPVVVLHNSNTELVYDVQNRIKNHVIIGRTNAIFDPFYNRSIQEITNIIREVAEKEYDLKADVRYTIEGMIKYMEVKNAGPAFRNFLGCPYWELSRKIDDMINNGKISANVGDSIRYLLDQGQNEYPKLGNFLDDLENECGGLLAPQGNNSYDVIKGINERKVVLIDVGSTGRHFISLIVAQLNMAARNSNFSILIDDVTISADVDALLRLITQNNNRYSVTISTNDLYSMLSSDAKSMSVITSNSVESIVMKHSTAVSAKTWSDTVGDYEMIEVTTTIHGGTNKGAFSLFADQSQGKALAMEKKNEYKIKPETIVKMVNNEMFICNRNTKQIRHLQII